MSLNDTPVANRLQIGFFGTANAGKSSLINRIAGQEVSVVSEKKGTTTDPVIKTMEMGGLGPVVLIDTPGLDDDTDIGALRIKRTNDIFNRIDLAVVVIDGGALSLSGASLPALTDILSRIDPLKSGTPEISGSADEALTDDKKFLCIKDFIAKCKDHKKPYVLAVNKSDLFNSFSEDKKRLPAGDTPVIMVSAAAGAGIEELKAEIIKTGKSLKTNRDQKLVSDLISPGDSVILVIPIDKAAPAGRIILPQQQVIRDILDAGGNAVCIRDSELEDFFETTVYASKEGSVSSSVFKPALVITDSQVFKKVSDIVPEEIPLTSFSILMARFKGTLPQQVTGARAIDLLEDGDTVLIAEGCTHHKTCEDIGTVKLPNMLKKHTGKDIFIETSSGHGYPEDLDKYKLILHCGGCMLGESEVKSRINRAVEAKVPVVNYGVAMAYMSGILKRSIEPIPEISM